MQEWWMDLALKIGDSSCSHGFKLTKHSGWRSKPIWQAIAANRNPSATRFMANQPSMGLQLAQLGRDASAAGAARRLNSQKKILEVVESVGVSGKVDHTMTVIYFTLEVLGHLWRRVLMLMKKVKR